MFFDLAKLKPGEGEQVSKYTKPINEYLKKTETRNGVDFVTQHISRPHNDRDLAIYKRTIAKWNKNRERLRYPDLPQSLKNHKNG